MSISGTAEIVNSQENKNIPKIYINLLEKYNYEGAPKWLNELVLQIKANSENSWLIEVTPKKYFVFNE